MLIKLLSGLAVAATIAVSYASGGAAAETGYAPQTSNERGIRITAILKNKPTGSGTWDFEVTLESHTQSLDDDLAKASVLVADGTPYTPLSWEGAPPGGHHRKGILHFKANVPQSRSMELQIRLAADAAPRSFKWLLK